MEIKWEQAFEEQLKKDLVPNEYIIVWNPDTRIQFFIKPEKTLVLEAQFFGDDIEERFGKDELEIIISLDADNTLALLTRLRLDHGVASSLQDVLDKAFKHAGTVYLFEKYCRDNGIQFNYKSY